jgi:hypothetical protein
MARDPLLVLRAVRRRAVEQARQSLAAYLKVETDAAAAVDDLAKAAMRDRRAAEDMPEACQFVQLFANRLDAIRTQRVSAMTALAAAQTRVSEARAGVATERTRAEAVEELIVDQQAASVAAAESKAQHELDDIARAARILRQSGRI